MGITSKQKSKDTLRKLAKKRSVFDLDALFDALGTRSRMTVFRRLRQVGYQHLLRVRAHNTLLELLRQGRIGRERLQDVYLYVSADSKRAAEQVAARKKLRASLAEMLRVATDEEVVEVLVEALRAAPEIPTPDTVAGRLVARGVRLEPHHVEQVYEEHGLVPGKKTVRQGSRSSRR
jgi:hypothetical protein